MASRFSNIAEKLGSVWLVLPPFVVAILSTSFLGQVFSGASVGTLPCWTNFTLDYGAAAGIAVSTTFTLLVLAGLGAIVTASGAADISNGANGAKAYFDCVNANGGINGRPIAYSMDDDQTRPDKAAEIAKKMVEDNKVVALVGSSSLVDCIATAQYYDQSGIISLMDQGVVRRAERVNTSSMSLFVSHYDLKERTKYLAGEEITRATMLEYFTYDRLSDLLDDFDYLRRRRIPPRPLTGGGDETHADPTRAPAGAGIFHAITMAPYNIEGHGPAYWDEIKEQEADTNLGYFRRFISNLTDDNIIMRTTLSPLDMERSSPNSFVNGDMHGCAPFIYQTVGHRPTPDLGQYTVPGANRLYLVGPFMHPGGGVYGAGRGTAIKMCDDLGIDFDKAIRT